MDTTYLNPVFEEFKTYYDKANKKFDFNKKEIGEKNILKFMNCLGKLAEEGNVYKFWKNEKADKDEVVEEFSKCVLMTFGFLYQLNNNLDDIVGEQAFDVVEMFLFIMNESSFLIYDFEELRVKSILANLLKLSKILKLPEDDILNACYFQLEKMLKTL